MKIKMYWPNCTLNIEGANFQKKDAFFLECSLKEAKEQLFCRLSEKQIRECMENYDSQPKPNFLEDNIETNKICFLITKDQKALYPEGWFIPFAGQWNGDSPFRRIKEIEMTNLHEIADIVVKLEDENK